MGLVAAMLPGLAAVAALVFTWVSVTQVSNELAISERGQIADRHDKAWRGLSDSSASVRRGAIFALRSIAQDSPREQAAVIDELSAYIRVRATKKLSTTEKAPDIKAALSVLRERDPSHDGNGTIDLRGAKLIDADLHGADLTGANLVGTVLSNCNLEGANLSGANLSRASLRQGTLRGANLTDAVLTGADLAGADLTTANLEAARLEGAKNLTSVQRPEADLPTSGPTPTSSQPAEQRDAQRESALDSIR
ncbi:pentapeptide repeat-containing protein [Streptomyces coeruleorubidus]|uniref:pentapeptide repeat-containing protein n=1 Tax=Streptomyces coeruleorubidus TaxID=116188 RepID=UPI00237F6AEB|nr:pentapeptide repeat-containing protein [Streptomyces coeruleorubidus]WDV56572.1 pentapeptide repeat-containing protein [Streptomyces coeruleorubidus]